MHFFYKFKQEFVKKYYPKPVEKLSMNIGHSFDVLKQERKSKFKF